MPDKQQMSDLKQMHRDARVIFQAGLAAVEPAAALHRHVVRRGQTLLCGGTEIDLDQLENIVVVGAGKASAPMAAAIEKILSDRTLDGLVNVKYGHLAPVEHIALIEAGHPLPDAAGVDGARGIIALASQAGPRDLVLCLISGGGSALLPLPADGITLSDKQAATDLLLKCGATIHEINTLRKHLSEIKGGRLALAAFPARVVSLILSDVVGDDLDVIASGPTVPDASTYGDCLAIVKKYDLENRLPPAVRQRLHDGAEGRCAETPKVGHHAFKRTHNVIIGTNGDALRAAAAKAEALDYRPLVLSSRIEGETRQVARVHGAIAREMLASGLPVAPPAALISGGETTVTVTGGGKGGRNMEFALAAGLDISDQAAIVCLSCGTDGSDGPTDAAGAVSDHTTVDRARQKGLDAAGFLDNNDAYRFFAALGDLVITGPTHTNVMDMRIILVNRSG
jgi:hydroxypyruvate reductase